METPGSLVDKISITNLKIWHLEDECRRTDVNDEHIAKCKRKIDILNQQRNDLIEEFDELIKSGNFKLYKQIKLYNDPEMKKN